MNKNSLIIIVALALFMEAVDTTIINTAIPSMAVSLAVNPINLKLALISYLLSLAIFIPISGWLADKYGIKRVFITAIAVFTLSSLWCGFTQNLWELIAARFVQGIGGSLTMPVGRLIILRMFQRHELIARMNAIVMVASVGMMLGPLLGGMITTYFSWRWIFWVNIPIGILNILLSWKLLPMLPPRKVPPLDTLGFVLFGLGLALLTFGLSLVSESNVSVLLALSLIVLALFLLLAYVHHSRSIKDPIVNVKLFKIRTFKVSVLGNLLTRLSFGGIPFLLPLVLQISLGLSPKTSGLLLAPVAVGVFLVKPLTLFFLRLLGYKRVLIINTLLVSCLLGSFCFINETMPLYVIAGLTFIYGFFIALQYSGMNSIAYADTSDEYSGSATSIISTIQQLAQSFGVAVSAMMLSFFNYLNHNGHHLSLTSFHLTFFSLAVLTLISTLIFTLLDKNDGIQLIKS